MKNISLMVQKNKNAQLSGLFIQAFIQLFILSLYFQKLHELLILALNLKRLQKHY